MNILDYDKVVVKKIGRWHVIIAERKSSTVVKVYLDKKKKWVEVYMIDKSDRYLIPSHEQAIEFMRNGHKKYADMAEYMYNEVWGEDGEPPYI